MKYIVIATTFFLLMSSKAQTVEGVFLNSNVSKLKNAKEYTLQVANLMPAEKYNYKPSKEEMEFGSQLLHISENLCWLSSSYLTINKNPLTEADSKLTLKKDIIIVVTKA
ncbi:MAG: hypothetical protein ABIU77_17215, partial [Ferruginibacter sp.]